ncbi:MAG: hypothetical protein KQJ78_19955 [Deltaproteobacteria bacterium]|nr:hypothetical protein [Deltaproteobacteria bacterium]
MRLRKLFAIALSLNFLLLLAGICTPVWAGVYTPSPSPDMEENVNLPAAVETYNFHTDQSGAVQLYIYSGGRKWTFSATQDMTVTQVAYQAWLAGSGTYTLTTKVTVNGNQVASWGVVPSTTYQAYQGSQPTNFALQTGDEVVVTISGGTYSTPGGAILDGDNWVTFSDSSGCTTPVISSFAGPTASISPGGNATLTWSVQDASQVTISPDVGAVDPVQGSTVVTPQITTTYTLTATNSCGSETASVVVQVGTSQTGCPSPNYSSFEPPNLWVQDMIQDGGYLFQAAEVAGTYLGLAVSELSTSARPTFVSFTRAVSEGSSANAWAVAVDRDRAYLGFGDGGSTGNQGGAAIYDISDRRNPVVVGLYLMIAGNGARAVAAYGDYLYLVVYNSFSNTYQLRVLNVANPSNISLVSTLNIPTVDPTGFVLRDGYLYLAVGPWAGGIGGLWIINVSNPSNPTVISQLQLPSEAGMTVWNPRSLCLAGNYLFLGYTNANFGFGPDDEWNYSGVAIIGVDNPFTPAIISRVSLGANSVPWDLELSGGYVYVATGGQGDPAGLTGVAAIKVCNPWDPSLYGVTLTDMPLNRICLWGSGAATVGHNNSVRQEYKIIDLSACRSVHLLPTRINSIRGSNGITWVPMYRAYNPNVYYHFFTISYNEFANAVDSGYLNESNGNPRLFYVSDRAVAGAQEIFRLYNPNSGRHYYTIRTAERDVLQGLGWSYERAEGYIFSSQTAETTEVYKLYHKTIGTHLYTSNSAEVTYILLNIPDWEQHASLGFAKVASAAARELSPQELEFVRRLETLPTSQWTVQKGAN